MSGLGEVVIFTWAAGSVTYGVGRIGPRSRALQTGVGRALYVLPCGLKRTPPMPMAGEVLVNSENALGSFTTWLVMLSDCEFDSLRVNLISWRFLYACSLLFVAVSGCPPSL